MTETTYHGPCSVCRIMPAVGIASSPFGPVSFRYCRWCLVRGAEPESTLIYLLEDVADGDPKKLDESRHRIVTFKDGRYLRWGDWLTQRELGIIRAPWTADQVLALNRWQRAGFVHEFTCHYEHEGDRVLVATCSGWMCPTCHYRQLWAHRFMLGEPVNPLDVLALQSWLKAAEEALPLCGNKEEFQVRIDEQRAKLEKLTAGSPARS